MKQHWKLALLCCLFLLSCKQKKVTSVTEKAQASATFKKMECNQSDFEQIVQCIIDLYNRKDAENLNQFIHSEIGLYFLYSTGSAPQWTNQKEIYLDTIYRAQSELPYWDRETLAFQQIKVKLPIKQTKSVKILDENPDIGLFYVENSEFQHRLSFYANVNTEYEVSDKDLKLKNLSEIEKIKKFEKETRYIVASWKELSGNVDSF
ncbi:MAG: hypothetical protein Q4B43_10555, partial [Bacteroidota bacterium]|nr:hypothetical protein [Bacteroidota bacterium]